MLVNEVGLNDRDVAADPLFVTSSGGLNVNHADSPVLTTAS
jgi:hypothetical protein